MGLRPLRVLIGFVALAVVLRSPSTAQQKSDIGALANQSDTLRRAGDYPGAMAAAQRMEALAKARYGTRHSIYAGALDFEAVVHELQGHYAEAEALYKRALAIREGVNGKPDAALGDTLNNFAGLYVKQGRYDEAEALFTRARAFYQNSPGDHRTEIASVDTNLGEFSMHRGRFSEAEKFLKQALSSREQIYGKMHSETAQTLASLGYFYLTIGQYGQAEQAYTQAVSIGERTLGANHPDLAVLYGYLAILYHHQNKYPAAEALYQRVLTIKEAALGPDNPSIAGTLNNLADLYRMQARFPEAERLFKRSLAITEKSLGPNHPDVGLMLANLGDVYRGEGRYAEAAQSFAGALSIDLQSFGEQHPESLRVLVLTGSANLAQSKFPEAEALYKRALAGQQKIFGPDHPTIAVTLQQLAMVSLGQNDLAAAETYFRQELAMQEKLGQSSPHYASGLVALTLLLHEKGEERDALSYSRRAVTILAADTAPLTEDAIQGRAEAYGIHLGMLNVATEKAIEPAAALAREALATAQLSVQSSAAAAIQQTGLRFAAGNDALAALVRERQDLAVARGGLDRALLAALSKIPAESGSAAAVRKQIADNEKRQNEIAARLDKEFPDYAALSRAQSMTAEEIQPLLSADEAIVLFAVGIGESYVFAITRETVDWKTIPPGADALSERVAAFRRGLDLEKIAGANPAADKSGLFDLGLANDLYNVLFGPLEPLIKDKKQLLVVPSGALTALPFNLLVTEKPAVAIPDTFDGYRDAAWLIKRQAVSVLPSVASLKALRAFARRGQGGKPMIGFGDPIFDFNKSSSGDKRAAALAKSAARSLATNSYTDFWQGAGVDRTKLAQALAPLPDTADELKAVALKLGVAASDIHLGSDASETVVKRAPLADYRIVYFATHGLVAGDVKGLAEPSLVLSIPKQPSELDDGLLTSSEVAQLKLNADFVVLSACNTIAGDKPGAEALSGLARSFFYAGARSMLVSHWAVESDAATRLTTSTFDLLKADPKLGRAEALRQAMLAYLNDASSPRNAYPALWGPFVLIGEGAAR